MKLAIKVMQKLNKSLHDEDFLLVAPTGKAARRMAETTDYAYTAQTIHSALHLYKMMMKMTTADLYLFLKRSSFVMKRQ